MPYTPHLVYTDAHTQKPHSFAEGRAELGFQMAVEAYLTIRSRAATQKQIIQTLDNWRTGQGTRAASRALHMCVSWSDFPIPNGCLRCVCVYVCVWANKCTHLSHPRWVHSRNYCFLEINKFWGSRKFFSIALKNVLVIKITRNDLKSIILI